MGAVNVVLGLSFYLFFFRLTHVVIYNNSHVYRIILSFERQSVCGLTDFISHSF